MAAISDEKGKPQGNFSSHATRLTESRKFGGKKKGKLPKIEVEMRQSKAQQD